MPDRLAESDPTAPETRLAARIVAAYVRSNEVPGSNLPKLIRMVRHALRSVANLRNINGLNPAVKIEDSITPDYLICLEDGRRLKMLKRYLKSAHNLTPQQYREKWRLPHDYPMVAPNYGRSRSDFAKRVGLGKHGRGAVTDDAD